ncbi:hypothetical protein BX070DRAFT_221195 [Coemansia spiralis]|nr:hypothetical protein BX070DRAFT_221195 [Coemansia spiralis]
MGFVVVAVLSAVLLLAVAQPSQNARAIARTDTSSHHSPPTKSPGHRVTRTTSDSNSLSHSPTPSTGDSTSSSSGCFYFCPHCPRGFCFVRCMTICPEYSQQSSSATSTALSQLTVPTNIQPLTHSLKPVLLHSSSF